MVPNRLHFSANVAEVGGNGTNYAEFEQTPTDELVPQYYVLHVDDHLIGDGCTTEKRTLDCQYPYTTLYPYVRDRVGETCALLSVLDETPLTIDALRRIPSVTPDQAGLLTFDPILDVSEHRADIGACLDASGLPRSLRRDVNDQLELVYAEHGYSSRFGCDQLAFFARCTKMDRSR